MCSQLGFTHSGALFAEQCGQLLFRRHVDMGVLFRHVLLTFQFAFNHRT